MIELIRKAAGTDPDRVAVIDDDEVVSYAELLKRTESAAAFLTAQGITRFAIVDIAAGVVVPLLAAASLTGAQACVYPPIEQADPLEHAEQFDHLVAVSRAGTALERTYDPRALFQFPADRLVGPLPGQRPHLILTTGTTGRPRGVRHDWTRLLRRVRKEQGAGPAERWLLCYGLHQFAGLQLVLHTAAAGATLVAPAPRRPRMGLLAMNKYAVTHASATPTYWRFLLAEMRASTDMKPQLRQVTLGGEAVPSRLLDDLQVAFPRARISHVYAASEFGSAVSVRDRQIGLPVSALEAGKRAGSTELKVVDGQLWVRSPDGMLGYWNEHDVDAELWRPTGDLVEIDGDRVYFRGRESDVINVGGVKVSPLPIEARVDSVRGVAGSRVFGRPNPLSGYIVAVEIVLRDGVDPDKVKDAVRDCCADLPPAARPRSVRVVTDLPTQGGKVVRNSHAG